MFAERREALMQALGESPASAGSENAAAIFPAARQTTRNGDVDHEFRQDSTFYYLTGFEEPEAVAVLRPQAEERFVLFVLPHDPEQAVWVGARAGVEGAIEQYGADAAYPIDELEQRLPELLEDVETLWFALGADKRLERLVSRLVARRRAGAQRGARPITCVADPTPLVDALRLRKSDVEVAEIQRAIDITAAGLDAAMRATRPGLHEYEVQAVLEAEFRRLGSPRNGFPSIVGSGPETCVLHYTSNRRQMQAGDLLLLDVGAEWAMYSADVTRTFPVDGRFTPEQRAVYDIVLEAQRRGIEAARPGAGFYDVHDAALRVLVQGLLDLGVLEGDLETAIEEKTYRPWYMHSTSHWLGLDVHDAGAYRTGEPATVGSESSTATVLEPGMVFTVEPGLYLSPTYGPVPDALAHIGIRIEDDVLITPDGHRVLSDAVPRVPEELEAIIGRPRE